MASLPKISRKKPERYSVTSIPVSPEEDRDTRFKQYAIAMGIRTVCVVLLVFVEGWALFFVALGAIFLPYFAVVTANSKELGNTSDVHVLPSSKEIS
jgi:cell division septal protein FtsQ